MPGYDAFQQAVSQPPPQGIGRLLSQDELNDDKFLQSFSLGLIRLLPAGRLETFPSSVLIQMDNNDLFNLIQHNPNIANQIPGWRLTRGNQDAQGNFSGGFSVDQLNQVLSSIRQRAPNDNTAAEIEAAIRGAGGAVGGGGSGGGGGGGGDRPVPTLAEQEFEARLANEPGNYLAYAFRSRGQELPPGLRPGAGAGAGAGGGGLPPFGLDPNSLAGPGASPPPPTAGGGGFHILGGNNPFASAGDQIVNQQRPTFDELRNQLQGLGLDVPPEIVNPILGRDTPTYQSQGGVPFFANQTLARMTPSARQALATTVNWTGGRAEDFFNRSRQLTGSAGRLPSYGRGYIGSGGGGGYAPAPPRRLY